jgi:glutamyl-tRNA synthetase
VGELRENDGIEPMAICSHLARLGTSDPVEPLREMAPLIEGFAFDRIGRAPARFDPAELRALNARLLHETPYEDVRERLDAMEIAGGEMFWNAVRANLTVLKDAFEWQSVIEGPIDPVVEDPEFAAAALAVLPEGELTRDSWGEWTGAVKTATGRKGKDLFLPLRLALTGKPKGPEMDVLLALIGRERAMRRLKGERA